LRKRQYELFLIIHVLLVAVIMICSRRLLSY
jgi:hypothetical protein